MVPKNSFFNDLASLADLLGVRSDLDVGAISVALDGVFPSEV